MKIYLLFYITYYLTSYPTYVVPQPRYEMYLNKYEAIRDYNEALEHGCDSVRLDSIIVASTAHGTSPREKQIPKPIAPGYTDEDISIELFIAPAAVAIHRHSIHQKIKSRNATDITRFALQKKILV
ncbi:hypothetical protein ES705_51116 [subsurface metagenome]